MMFIAFTYPFSYSECTMYFDKVHAKINREFKEEIYFCRELLTQSLEGRNVELITITGMNGVSEEEREEEIEGLFKELTEENDKRRFSAERAHRVKGKKCIFLSARVHPGEVQSSFVLNGIVDFLLSK